MATFGDFFGRLWSGAKQEKDDVNFPEALLEKYSILKIIGRGAFGIVYEVTEKKSNGKYALKYIKTEPHTLQAQIKEVLLSDPQMYITSRDLVRAAD